MSMDPYRNIAGMYDRLFESMNKGLRLVGIRMFRPTSGMRILDVGCGTGAHLELYQRYACRLSGLDASPAMLKIARKRLGETASLNRGDATDMPFEDQSFDLVIAMLTLHEMSEKRRSAVIAEMERILKKDGRILFVDFHTGPYRPLQGWISKVIILISELAAGREHFRNYRHFMRIGGIPSMIREDGLRVEKQQILAGGTFGVYLMEKMPPPIRESQPK